MEIQILKITPPPDVQIILGQSHFIKTVEDVSECLVSCVPNIKYGIGFCEASGPCLVRHAANEQTNYHPYYLVNEKLFVVVSTHLSFTYTITLHFI